MKKRKLSETTFEHAAVEYWNAALDAQDLAVFSETKEEALLYYEHALEQAEYAREQYFDLALITSGAERQTHGAHGERVTRMLIEPFQKEITSLVNRIDERKQEEQREEALSITSISANSDSEKASVTDTTEQTYTGDALWNFALDEEKQAEQNLKSQNHDMVLRHYQCALSYAEQARDVYVTEASAMLDADKEHLFLQYATQTQADLVDHFTQKINELKGKSVTHAQAVSLISPASSAAVVSTISPAQTQASGSFFPAAPTHLHELRSLEHVNSLEQCAFLTGSPLEKITQIRDRLLEVKKSLVGETDMPSIAKKLNKAGCLLKLSIDFNEKLVPWSKAYVTNAEEQSFVLELVEDAKRSVLAAMAVYKLHENAAGKRQCRTQLTEVKAKSEDLTLEYAALNEPAEPQLILK